MALMKEAVPQILVPTNVEEVILNQPKEAIIS